MKKIFSCLSLIFYCLVSFSQEKIQVFKSGSESYNTFRIPAIISLPNGDILAFCEGRVNSSADFGNIDIVMKRSHDHGRTWSAIRTVVDMDSLQAGNPAPVVDLTDPEYPGGRIFLFYNTGNNNEGEVRKGNGVREVLYRTSTDNGNTWSDPVNITMYVHRPKHTAFNPAYDFPEDWRSFANTPGHAMQFRTGKYKGRIFVAANHSAGDPQREFMDYKASGYYTDDHGETFKISMDVNLPGSNESTAVELSDNRLMMNSRNQRGDVRARIISVSLNGGETWDSTWFDRSLPDPVNEGSILSLEKGIVAFSNAANEKRRDNLTLRISYDEGRTWKKNILVESSPDGKRKDFTAYSDLVRLSRKRIGVLYERDGYKQIVFTAIRWRR
ncbi:MAG TPA: sialidase family protein [Bacteroidales bacterium]|nr:sialidase family protein [Bacteroidales bacterium]